MTVRDIVLALLRTSGITTLDPDLEENSLHRRGIATGDLDDAIQTVNASLQELCAKGPAALTERTIAEVLRPATQVAVTVTQYSKTVNVVSGWQSWMKGCTIRLGSDDQDNVLNSQTTIRSPFLGDSGTVDAWVYGDTIALPSRYLNIIEPIDLPDRRLVLAADAAAFRQLQLAPNITSYETMGTFQRKAVGNPLVAFVDQEQDDTVAYLPIYLRVNPMPDRAAPITFRVKLKPPTFTRADFDNGDDETDPNAVIPLDWHESILLPIAKKRWTAHNSVSLEAYQLAEINRQYQVAIESLDALRPKPGSTRATYK